MGFIRVANEAMCRPIRALTQVSYIRTLDAVTLTHYLKRLMKFVFNHFVTVHRQRDMTHLGMSWHVLVELGVSMLAQLLAHWEWELSSYTSKMPYLCIP